MIKKLLFISAFLIFSYLDSAVAQTVSSGFSDIGATSDQPITIESEELEILDEVNTAIFRRDVEVTQGETTLQTKELTVYYRDNENQNGRTISKFEANGGVLVTSENQVASGDYGVFDYDTNTLELTGERVALTEDNNIAVGDRLIVYLDTGRILLQGEKEEDRVRIFIEPKGSTDSNNTGN